MNCMFIGVPVTLHLTYGDQTLNLSDTQVYENNALLSKACRIFSKRSATKVLPHMDVVHSICYIIDCCLEILALFKLKLNM